ncbi:hypothetical protein [Desulfotomaculum sp. 1211_IL3151]|uniref:hypothetical protein n=1 Tax=Desulfotomaculum sp. 1211_IL3151 TaxID=3084055 RepID=UPI002FDB1CD4
MTKDNSKGVGFFGATFAGVTENKKNKNYDEEYSRDVAIPEKDAKEFTPKSNNKQ